MKTPEGVYTICEKNPHSHFYRSLRISYPNRDDARRGLQQGLIGRTDFRAIERAIQRGRVPLQQTKLGGDVFLHGGGSLLDWTWGCVALDNRNMQTLYPIIAVGTPVLIEP